MAPLPDADVPPAASLPLFPVPPGSARDRTSQGGPGEEEERSGLMQLRDSPSKKCKRDIDAENHRRDAVYWSTRRGMTALARRLATEYATMAPRIAGRASWFMHRLLHRMEARLQALRGTGTTLPFLVEEWRESCAHLRERGETIAPPLPDHQEELAVRAWAQTIIDEMQELLGRITLREVLGLCPGEPVLHWADNEASTWERLLRLEAAMEGDHGGEEAGPSLTGGARGSDDPRPLPDAPAQSPAEVAAEEEHRHQAFLALVHSLTREDEDMPTQPEAEPDSGPGVPLESPPLGSPWETRHPSSSAPPTTPTSRRWGTWRRRTPSRTTWR